MFALQLGAALRVTLFQLICLIVVLGLFWSIKQIVRSRLRR